MRKIKLLSFLLALLTVVSLFTACGGGEDTTISGDETDKPVTDAVETDAPETDAPETDAPETDAPETDAPETDAPETDAPETDAPETDAPETDTPKTDTPKTDEPKTDTPETDFDVVIENGKLKSAWFDFESKLGIVDYISGMEGFSVNDKLKGGEISDGKWVYSGSPLAIKDDCGIFELDAFSVRFDICFNSFVNKDGTSVFTFITDDDGVLGSGSVFYALKADMDGTLYHFNQKDKAMQLERGKAYTIRYDIDRITKKAQIYFNGDLWVSAGFALTNDAYNCFRFIDSGRGADLWIDNFIISDTPLMVETIAPDSEPSDTPDDTETDTPDGNESDTQPDSFEKITLDFESKLGVVDYLAGVQGLSVNSKLHGGEISDGKWVYSGSPLAIGDDCGIFDVKKYSLEFDICFNSFVNKDGTSVFTFITDNDGTLDGSSSFYALKMDTDGKLYHFSLKANSIQVEPGRVYNIRYEINRESESATIYVDDTAWVMSTGYAQKNQAYNCFRFMDVNRGADVWFDNFTVSNADMKKINFKDIVAIDAAYVSGGSNSNTALGLAEGKYIDIKYVDSTTHHMYREGLIKFDISSVDINEVGYTKFLGGYVNMSADRTFDVYWIENDWDGKTVTFNSVPEGYLIAQDVTFGGAGAPLELAPYLIEAIRGGETEFSIRLVPKYQTGAGQTRIFFEDGNKPTIKVYFEKKDKSYFEKLVEDEKANAAIWDYAQQMYDEWYARYRALPAVNGNAEMLEPDASQYTVSNYASGNSGNFKTTKKSYNSRPLEALNDLDEYVSAKIKNAKLDKYGGIMVESLKQKATGFFYTMKINGRWFIIDPLGYPYISVGLSSIDYSLNGSALQKENALKKYGTYENWALATTKQVRDELNFNSTCNPKDEIKNVDDGLPYVVNVGSVMSKYGYSMGIRGNIGTGSTAFTENNTIPVFNPDFVSFADYNISKAVADLVDDPRIIGYTSDNELPMDVVMLDNSLTVDHSKPINYYTYACAWTWLVNMTGKESPTHADITDELRDLYRGFVYDRYFYIVSTAIKQADPNHMYVGCRFLTVSKDSEWVYRFAAQYLDIMTINWYFCWEPETEALYGIERNGDMPFIVTEFYTKAGDSGLGNSSGAGWYVETQKDRADYYETFTIKLLESNNCVGWQWFHYMDNDPNSGTGDRSSIDSNKGIYSNDYNLYTEFTDRMAVLNENVYNIIDYFANKNSK